MHVYVACTQFACLAPNTVRVRVYDPRCGAQAAPNTPPPDRLPPVITTAQTEAAFSPVKGGTYFNNGSLMQSQNWRQTQKIFCIFCEEHFSGRGRLQILLPTGPPCQWPACGLACLQAPWAPQGRVAVKRKASGRQLWLVPQGCAQCKGARPAIKALAAGRLSASRCHPATGAKGCAWAHVITKPH